MDMPDVMSVILIIGFFGVLGWHVYQKMVWRERENELCHKVDVVNEEVLLSFPLAAVVIDQRGAILWHNLLFGKMIGQEKAVRGKISQYLPELLLRKHSWFPKWKSSKLSLRGRIYRAESKELSAGEAGSRILLIFEDITQAVNLEQRFQDDHTVIGVIQIDNFSEVFQGADDEKRGMILAAVDKVLNEWAFKLEGYIKKFGEDKYILVTDQGHLKECQNNRFEIVDRVREIGLDNKVPITLSMGIGVGEETITDLSRLAYSGLDLALGRGGDQAVLKWPDKVLFYGGKSNAPEKKTKVRARVVAYTLKQYILQASEIIIMGHESSDLDSAGASLGIAKITLDLMKPAFVVADNLTGALDNLFLMIKEFPEYTGKIISGKEALQHSGENTLLVICDAHKPSLLIEPEILKKVHHVIVIDHHRRAEESIENAQLVYVEPYASSTSELVAEIIQYLSEDVTLEPFSASALLAGIVVDTKNFVLQTGVRTFEAAGYLRRSGAEPGLVRRLLQDDFDTLLQRAQVIKDSEIWFGNVAVGVLDRAVPHGAIIAAKTADILLTAEGINASFVLYPVSDGVNISGRSNGDMNVQVLLEKLGGGGHFNVAGAKLKGATLAGARETLKKFLEENLIEDK